MVLNEQFFFQKNYKNCPAAEPQTPVYDAYGLN